MVNLNNFNINSRFPTLQKNNTTGTDITMPQITIQPNNYNQVTKNVNIGSGSIISTSITYGGKTIISPLHAIINIVNNGTTTTILSADRISANVIRVSIYRNNFSQSAVTFPAITVNFNFNAFLTP